MLLREWKGKQQTGKNYLQSSYVTKDLYAEYAKNLNVQLKQPDFLLMGKKCEQTFNQRRYQDGRINIGRDTQHH